MTTREAANNDYSFDSCSTVSFDPSSRGQIAMVIYEWRDAKYLGIDTEPDNYLVPVSSLV